MYEVHFIDLKFADGSVKTVTLRKDGTQVTLSTTGFNHLRKISVESMTVGGWSEKRTT